MRRLVSFSLLTMLLTIALLAQNTTTIARARAQQTAGGVVTDSSQLRLASAAFPSEYTGDDGVAWTPSRADASISFPLFHSSSYTALGMQGGWYQYYARVIFVTVGTVQVATPVEVVYLGTFYADEARAAAAFQDVVPRAALTNPVACSYGKQCVTYQLDHQMIGGLPYSGFVRVIQQGNALAEIRTNVLSDVYGSVSTTEFMSNLDGVSRAFVEHIGSPAPTSTPARPTATTVPATATPTQTATATATATPTRAPVPLFVQVTLAKKTVKSGSRQRVSATTLPGAHVLIVVRFPNGTTKRHAGTSSAEGILTWSFTQPGRTTTASKRTATVSVTVSDAGGTQAKTSKSYKIDG